MRQDIQPHKVTKPIQLLAAWLLGLLALDGAFLTAARLITTTAWIPGLLVIAAIVSVPLFLACIFLLQTRFRPEMQEDSYYSKYLALQQQTLKIDKSEDQVAQLREMLVSSQMNLSEGIAALDDGLAKIRNQLLEVGHLPDHGAAEGVFEASQRVLKETRNRLLPVEISIEVNDLLPMYEELRRRWQISRIKVKETFGSTSLPPRVPVYPVISFGSGVSSEAMHEVCESIINTGQWHVEFVSDDISAGRIYVGSYGYGGNDVTPLSADLLREMAEPGFSTARLVQWISDHSVKLDADYPQGPPPE